MALVSTIETFEFNTSGTGAQILYTANDPNGVEYLIIDVLIANTSGVAGLIDVQTVTTQGTQFVERRKVVRSNIPAYRVPFKVLSLEDSGMLQVVVDASPPSWTNWTQSSPTFSVTTTVVKTVDI